MESTNIESHLNQFKNLKNLFSKLVRVADNIRALNNATHDDKLVNDPSNEYSPDKTPNGSNAPINTNGAVGLIEKNDSIEHFGAAVNVRDSNEFNGLHGWNGTVSQSNVGLFRGLDYGSVDNFHTARNAVCDANEFNGFHSWNGAFASIDLNNANYASKHGDSLYKNRSQFNYGTFRDLDSGSIHNFGTEVNTVRDANEFNGLYNWNETFESINDPIENGAYYSSKHEDHSDKNRSIHNFGTAVNTVRDANEFDGPIKNGDNYSPKLGNHLDKNRSIHNFGTAVNAVCDANEFNGLHESGASGPIGSNDVKNGNTLDLNVPKHNVSSFNDLSTGVIDKSFINGNVEISDIDGHSSCNIKIIPRQGCDNSNMHVPTSNGKVKTLACVYCLKRVHKLARHLFYVHKDEVDVKKFRILKPGSKERRKIIERLRKRGQFEWNTNPKINNGELLTSRRPNQKFKKTAFDYLTCANCFGTFAKTILTRHWNKCTKKLMEGGRIVKTLGRAVEGRLHADASDELRTDVFARIREDVRVRNIRFDWLVIAYGNELCLNYSPHYQHGYIRKKLRDAAKVLFAAKCVASEIEDFESLFHVKNCNTVVEAICVVAKFDRQTKLFGSPGTASTLVTLINTIGTLLVVESMKKDDPEKERNVERFLKVFQADVKTKVHKLVTVTQANNRRGKTANIPTTEDVNKLATFLESQREERLVELTQEFSYQKWIQLSELTMASILVFNRRRTGEMVNIIVDDFHRRDIISDQCDMEFEALSEETKRMINSRMKIRGKLGRTVPVLLKHSFENCIEVLLRHRKDAGITENNEFLFAMPSKFGQIKTIDACAVIRSFSVACGANNPSSLRGTKLRKQLATYVGTKGLCDSDVTNVANFMGHDDKIHRDIYRQNALDREVEQMTSLLVGAQTTRKKKTCTTDVSATNVKAMQAIISSDTSSDSSSDSYDDEPENCSTKTRKRKLIRKRGPNKVKKLSQLKNRNVRKNGTDFVGTKKKVVGKRAVTQKNNKARKISKGRK